MSEKTLPATQQKLEKSRREGQSAISKEIVKFVVYAVIFELIYWMLPAITQTLHVMISSSLSAAHESSAVRMQTVMQTVRNGVLVVAPLSALALVLVVLAIWPQSGFVVAPKALTRGLDRLNPGKNLSNYFSVDKMLMLVVGPLKIALLLTVAAVCIRAQLPDLMNSIEISVAQFGTVAAESLRALELRLLVVFLILSLFDLSLQKKLHLRRQRMNAQDMKDEQKQSMGDPQTRSEQKQRGREMIQEGKRVEKANAVVVNPSHIAIGLWYELGTDTLPIIVSKGSGDAAEAIKRSARENRVAIVKYVDLARRLYAVGKIGQGIPAGTGRAVGLLYTAVAEIHASTNIPLDDRLHLAEVDPELGAEMLPMQGPGGPGGPGIGPIRTAT